MQWEVSKVAWFSCIYMVATLVALAAMAGALRFVATRNQEARFLASRYSRVLLWVLPFAVAAWFALSILVYEPIVFTAAPGILDPYAGRGL